LPRRRANIQQGGLCYAKGLPLTFPESLEQTPRPVLSGLGTPWGTPTTIIYNEGSDAGYRWYAKKNIKPMYAFGYGLSYTSFSYGDLKLQGGQTVTVDFTVTNTGKIAGADVPQLYLTNAAGENTMRLLGFERVEFAPGESKQITLTVDPRLLAHFDWEKQKWQIKEGDYEIALGQSAVDLVLNSSIKLPAQLFGK
jgi:beta-glucosidase